MPVSPIDTYTPAGYVQRFAAGVPSPLGSEATQFFVVPVEEFYPLFGRALPPTRATGHTCLYLTSGTARMSVGNELYAIGAQQALVVRAGQVYAFEPGDVNTGYLCHFHDDLLLGGAGAEAGAFAFLQHRGYPVVALDAETGPFAAQVLARLLAEYRAHRLRYPAVVRAYLLALLHELDRAQAAAAPAAPSAAAALTARFKQLVAAELATTHRVADYAARLHVTADHLGRCVRRVTGKSPARWLEESAVLEAKVLLFQSRWPVGEVAAAVGVPDASYFSRLFKKHTGLTPLAFRKRAAAAS